MKTLTPTEDIRAARHKLAARFGNNLEQIVADLQRQQVESDAEFITLPSCAPKYTTIKPMHPSGGSTVSENSETSPAAR